MKVTGQSSSPQHLNALKPVNPQRRTSVDFDIAQILANMTPTNQLPSISEQVSLTPIPRQLGLHLRRPLVDYLPKNSPKKVEERVEQAVKPVLPESLTAWVGNVTPIDFDFDPEFLEVSWNDIAGNPHRTNECKNHPEPQPIVSISKQKKIKAKGIVINCKFTHRTGRPNVEECKTIFIHFKLRSGEEVKIPLTVIAHRGQKQIKSGKKEAADLKTNE